MTGLRGERDIVDFQDGPAWQSLDDRVMGGVSRSRMRVTSRGTGIFAGHVSLERGGGFASVCARLEPLDLSAFGGVEIKLIGDGERYRLRFKAGLPVDGVVHQTEFVTTPNEMETIRFPFGSFQPVFRGQRVPGYPPLDTRNIHQIGLLIVKENQGTFRLELEWIRAYEGSDHTGRRTCLAAADTLLGLRSHGRERARDL